MKRLPVPKALVSKMDFSEFDAFVTITGFSHYFVHNKVGEGFEVMLMREPGNCYDEYAIAVYSCGSKIGYVANSTDTVRKDTMSARQLAALMENSSKAEIVEYTSYDALCRVSGVYDIDKICMSASKYIDNQEYEQALELYYFLNDIYDSEMTNQYIADCLIKLERYEESFCYIENALKFNPLNPASRMMHGVALLNTGSYMDALKIFTNLLEEYNNNSKVFCERAICYTKLGETDKAKEDIEKSIKLDPKNLRIQTVWNEIMSM